MFDRLMVSSLQRCLFHNILSSVPSSQVDAKSMPDWLFGCLEMK